MTLENNNWLIRSSKILLPLFGGISITLFIEVIAGDLILYHRFGVPIGWFFLWLITTSIATAIGVSALVLKSWRRLPLSERRGMVLGYLMIGMVNILSIVSHVSSVRIIPDNILWVVFGYGLLWLGAHFYLNYEANNHEEIFP